MTNSAQVGDFCPNKICADYGKRQSDQQHNIWMGRHRRRDGRSVVLIAATCFYRLWRAQPCDSCKKSDYVSAVRVVICYYVPQ
jgi:hypothetical protein